MTETSTADRLARPTLRPDPDAATHPGWVAGLVAAAWAAGIGFVLLGAPAMLVWADDGASAALAPTLASAADLWLVAQGSGAQVDGMPVDLVPWGLAVLPLLLLHRAGRWAAVAAGVSSPRSALRVLAVTAGAYGGAAGLVALLAGRDGMAVSPARAVLATGAVAALGAGTGLARDAGLWPPLRDRVPARVRDVVAAAVTAAAAVLAGGAVLLALTIAVHLGRVHDLLVDVGGGLVGGALLTLLGAALLPNAAVWAAAVSLGPGFAVGVDTSFGTGSVRLGAVPALPLLGGLPESLPTWVGALLLLVPAGAGGVAAWVLHRRQAAAGRSGRVAVLVDAALAAAAAGILLGATATISGGGVGDGHLAQVGPVPWQVAAAGAAEVGVVAVAAVLLLAWRGRSTDAAG